MIDMTSNLRINCEALLFDPLYLGSLRKEMLDFAKLKLQDNYLAEGVVQEALVRAINNVNPFRSQSAVKTWVFPISLNRGL
jgi:RNA polymerase sigma-70 factor (ECF subfamily)